MASDDVLQPPQFTAATAPHEGAPESPREYPPVRFLDEIVRAFDAGQAAARAHAEVRDCKVHGMAVCPHHITMTEIRRAGAAQVLARLVGGDDDGDAVR